MSSTPVWKIPLSVTTTTDEDRSALLNVLGGGWLAMGESTRAFEEDFARMIGCRHAIAVANGTAALHIAHRVLGIGPGDEVICPSLTFIAGPNAIRYCGAAPVFADIRSEHDLTLDPGHVAERVTARTRAIQVMHYGGFCCDMDAFTALARRRGLALIEDCAHSPGARIGDRSCGRLGDIACFSFYANKNITCGEGGMITTDKDDLAEKARRMRSHGMTSLAADRHYGSHRSYDVVQEGYNYRIDDLRAALGRSQLGRLAALNEARGKAAALYRERLRGIPWLHVPFLDRRKDESPSFHIFPIVLDSAIDRDRFISHMKSRGVQTSIHYPPAHSFSYSPEGKGSCPDLPRTEDVGGREVTLPLYPGLGEPEIELIGSACEEFRTIGS